MGYSYDAVDAEIKWTEVFCNGGPLPRLMSVQGDIHDSRGLPYYRHPIDEDGPPVVSWTPLIEKIKIQLEDEYKQSLNHCIIQKYRNGSDFIGRHSDKTIDILENSRILNFSLGATRYLELRDKKTKIIQLVPLLDNSVFVLDWEMNKRCTHAIKKDHTLQSPRISLTFRTIATFKLPNGTITGQGGNLSRKEIFDSFHKDNN